ncbi:hypothetical protein COCNU_09G000380 [Cocos nucifera]|uniref:BZIP domain-containing protein n=1 Tax=Cocos nucifera TaxID=13894 RepID=A0A8K0IJ54_COCNU|nr:hypothetical protein COCNU_09G000380 [Cocos nucifera]
MGKLLRKNQDDQQFLWKQHYENADDSFHQSSPEEITFENFLIELGIIQKGHSSYRTSFQPLLPTVYDTFSLQMNLEGTSLERMAHGDHWSPESIMSDVGPRRIFYKMSMMKIEGHEQMVGDESHQNLENIMSKAYPIEVCYNAGGRMGITGISVQQSKMKNESHLGSAMRGISLEEMCFTGIGSIRTRIIEEQQLGMESSITPISMDGQIIKIETYNSKEMEEDRNIKRKRKVYKTVEQQMEKKRKDRIKNRESASRSRVRREV